MDHERRARAALHEPHRQPRLRRVQPKLLGVGRDAALDVRALDLEHVHLVE